MHTILVLIGSTKRNSANRKLVTWLTQQTKNVPADAEIRWIVYEEMEDLPYFNPDADKAVGDTQGNDLSGLPAAVAGFRKQLAAADALLVCTPEYVFSLPGILKNALEWLVSTTLLTDKPAALITAAASGEKAQEQLLLIMKTLGVRYSDATIVLIKGIQGKLDAAGQVTDTATAKRLQVLLAELIALVEDNSATNAAVKAAIPKADP